MRGNSLFERCDLCGKSGRADDGFITHTFGGFAGYGSVHDGEYITLHICSECLDQVLGQRPPQEEQAADA